VAVQHRQSLKFLYARTKAPCGEYASMVLFGRVGSRGVQPVTKCSPPKGSIFWDIANLKHMDPVEAAGTIMGRKIPFLIAIGALGEKSKNPILIQALIEQMSPAELMNNTKMLERMGLRDHPNLRAAYDKAITKAAKSKSSASFKASVAAEQVDDPILKARLQEVQEKQIQQNASIEGDWLVLADKSGSMQSAIEASRHVAGALAKMVKGKVYLMFFDTSVVAIDVTGMSYEEISAKTRTITAGGGTSIGAGLMCSMERNIRVDGIAILSDGGENASPYFHEVYPRYCKKMDADPAVYFYRMGGRSVDCFSVFMERAKIQVTTFDLAKHGVDYYALPAIAKTMRVGRYSLVDEIMNTPLMTLQEVYGKTKGASVPTSGSGNVHKGEEVYA
jgi:hypothetical protein